MLERVKNEVRDKLSKDLDVDEEIQRDELLQNKENDKAKRIKEYKAEREKVMPMYRGLPDYSL